MTNYIIKDCPDCSQWTYTNDKKAARVVYVTLC